MTESDMAPAAETKRFSLCGCAGCCPEVTVYPDKIEITDDYDGKVTLTHEQWRDALGKVQVS